VPAESAEAGRRRNHRVPAPAQAKAQPAVARRTHPRERKRNSEALGPASYSAGPRLEHFAGVGIEARHRVSIHPDDGSRSRCFMYNGLPPRTLACPPSTAKTIIVVDRSAPSKHGLMRSGVRERLSPEDLTAGTAAATHDRKTWPVLAFRDFIVVDVAKQMWPM
jgi:hypothetical protein